MKMDFDIGTLIYIIITIVAVVAGALGNKKKPVPGKQGSSGSSSSGGFFNKLEQQFSEFTSEVKDSVQSTRDEFTMNEAPAETYMAEEQPEYNEVVEEYTEQEESEQGEYADFEGIYTPGKEENIDLIQQEAIRATDESEMLEVIEMDEASHPDYFEIVSDFDLGTAVIYSSIINRIEY